VKVSAMQAQNLTILEAADGAASEFDASDPAVMEMLYACQKRHFWFTSRNAAIADSLRRVGLTPPARILEVGCGTGTVLAHLIKRGYRCDGVDMHADLCRRAAMHCPEARIVCADIRNVKPNTLEGAYSAVGLFDVIEHVDDPVGLLRAAAGRAAPGGLVVGTVPALKCLWSAADEAGGHRQRYDLSSLRSDLEAAGLAVVATRYFFQALTPVLYLQRLLMGRLPSDPHLRRRAALAHTLRIPPWPVNLALGAVCGLERLAARVLLLGRVPGASLLFAARTGQGTCRATPGA
jgi:2-polyprenyl-3-methyl-5-hydroxy-6-metoxy-1,4-benzoquinol methylase